MSVVESLKIAFRGILSNKMRSILTMLGVIIGVAAVIALVSIGQGAADSVSSQIRGLGSNLITVSARSGRGIILSMNEVEEINGRIPSVTRAIPSLAINTSARWLGNTQTAQRVEGTNSDYPQVRAHRISMGRFISTDEVTARARVAVLGSNVWNDLVRSANPIGQEITLAGQLFTIIGVMEEKGASFGQNQDNLILIPISTAQRLAGVSRISTIYVQAESEEKTTVTAHHIRLMLERNYGREEILNVQSQDEIITIIEDVTRTLSLMLAAIAGISLLVGGIGIMNIMLVSVTERTREIGIRKAFGARRSDITVQFLIEAVTVSLIGGMIGIAVGLSGAYGVSRLLGWGSGFSLVSVVVAFFFALAVGLFFGVYPAMKAAALDPIEALRYE